MARYSEIKNSFIAGEISPKMFGRVDLPQHKHACEVMENMVVMQGGGAARRMGTVHQRVTNGGGGNGNPARLIPWIISQNETYILELTNGAARVIRTEDNTIYNVSNFGGGFGPLGHHFATDELFQVQYAQSVDSIYLVHPTNQPQVIKKINATPTFYMGDVDKVDTFFSAFNNFAYLQVPYRDPNIDTNKTITPSATTGSGITLTAVGFTFDANHVDAFFKLTHSGTTGAARITAVALGGATATADVFSNFGATTATDDWEEGSWSAYRGFPRAVSFFENRIIYGGNTSEPDTLWASRVNNYEYMMQKKFAQDPEVDDVAETDPFSITLDSRQFNNIQWLDGSRVLSVGTSGAEYIVRGPDPVAVLSPAGNISAYSLSSFGSFDVQPKRVKDSLLFAQNLSSHVLDLEFTLDQSEYKVTDLNLFADHLIEKNKEKFSTSITSKPVRIQQMEYQRGQTPKLWCVDNNGGLFSVTYSKELQVAGWSYHLLGGSSASSNPPLVRSVACVPLGGTKDLKNERVYFSVTRQINGNTVNYIEYIEDDFTNGTIDPDVADYRSPYPIFMDSSKRVNAAATTSHTGFTHLAGETVQVMADGFIHPDVVVSGAGGITLNYAAETVIAGLENTPKLKPVRPEVGAITGTSHGKMQRVNEITIRLYKTLGLLIGPDETHLSRIEFREFDLPQDDLYPVFTGDKDHKFEGSYDKDVNVIISHDQPLPLNVIALVYKGQVYD